MAQASATFTKLRAEVEELNSAIETQQLVLHGLMTKRSKARRQLNNLFLDPMARLPFELQSQIMILVPLNPDPGVYSRDLPKPSPNVPPMALLGVCRLWREIALATPQLWAGILMDSLPRAPNYVELSKIWLGRARNFPLSLELSGRLNLGRSVQDLITHYRHQLENLTLTFPLSYLNRSDLLHQALVLDLDDASPLSALKTLTLESTDEEVNFTSMGKWLNILRAAPGLLSCSVSKAWFRHQEEGLQPLTLASLTELRLGEPYGWMMVGDSASSCTMLRYLTLPALKSLTLSVLDITPEEFFTFLTRSSPPLESFDMAVPDNWNNGIVSRCFGLMPSLASLKLIASPTDIELYTPFLDVLATDPKLLPNLREIQLRTDCPVTIDYRKVLRMITFRFTACPKRLEKFELTWAGQERDFTPDLPDEPVRAAMRQLVKDGLHLRLGHFWAGSL
ncbi:hypothetical protein R3P38DRAFT_2960742 [Favolaschia claudopus]|uniref:F-box domain-containing protein n=1 Tax=Favolaschia claudopus TaxID=2862362 RepID=A0AAW0B9E4_9AGAR